ncbi:unnamed protein product [Trichogramma brassicae]|uniref:Uncharacterized protein n=1 Tax=Trichogramma brassicae TaxID=86971 RepID=A0A6H5IEB4_9HYME|nr:uncharacterized protein C12orf73 [Trichogramma pretiosum]CAB0033170.1 unnamed protein product [Trichogramma brassicae]
MPAGLSWPRYISIFAASILTSFAGAQCVHMYYKPLDDLEQLVQQELERRRRAREESKSSASI